MGMIILIVLAIATVILVIVGTGVMLLSRGIVLAILGKDDATHLGGDVQTHETFMMEEWRHNTGRSNPLVVVREHTDLGDAAPLGLSGRHHP